MHPLQGVRAAQGVISVPKAVCILGAAAPGTGVSPSCRAQRLSGTLPPHASSFRLMGYKKILNGLIAARVGVFQAQPGHSREFRLSVIAEINGRLVCDQLVGPVHPPEPLTGLSSGTARCACNLLYHSLPSPSSSGAGGLAGHLRPGQHPWPRAQRGTELMARGSPLSLGVWVSVWQSPQPKSPVVPPCPTHRLQLELGTHRPLPHGRQAAGEGLPDAGAALQGCLRASLQPRHRTAAPGRPAARQDQLLHRAPGGRARREGAGAPLLPTCSQERQHPATSNQVANLASVHPRCCLGAPGHGGELGCGDTSHPSASPWLEHRAAHCYQNFPELKPRTK